MAAGDFQSTRRAQRAAALYMMSNAGRAIGDELRSRQ
jgi:hypothetical protein